MCSDQNTADQDLRKVCGEAAVLQPPIQDAIDELEPVGGGRRALGQELVSMGKDSVILQTGAELVKFFLRELKREGRISRASCSFH